jgi:hypothetical protein
MGAIFPSDSASSISIETHSDRFFSALGQQGIYENPHDDMGGPANVLTFRAPEDAANTAFHPSLSLPWLLRRVMRVHHARRLLTQRIS